MPQLVGWLSARQHAPEGGFSGRTGKLVDGCYSHWVGGCWPFIQAALGNQQAKNGRAGYHGASLFSREGLGRYILCCCQANGGLRDKPSKCVLSVLRISRAHMTYRAHRTPDGYHSCYILAGLSSVQHQNRFDKADVDEENPLGCAFAWSEGQGGAENSDQDGPKLFEEHDLLLPVHPIFVIPFEAVQGTRAWCKTKTGF